MKKLFAAIFVLLGVATPIVTHAKITSMLFSVSGIPPGGGGGAVAPDNVALPAIVGLDTVGSTLSADPGVWSGSAATYTYNWHMIGGTTLGTAATFGPLTSGQIGQRLQVEVTATNIAGNQTQISDFVGPVEASLPTACAPNCGGAGTAPTVLPVYPANFIENGHAIYPGCTVPPVAPTSTPANVWYFDPINGRTLGGMQTGSDGGAIITAGSIGHTGHPFKDPIAIFGGAQGYGSLANVTSIGPITSTQAWVNGTGFGSQGGNSVYLNIGGTWVKQSIQAWGNTAIEVNLSTPGFTPTLATTEVDLGLFGHGFIQPGDVAYVKPGVGQLGNLVASGAYSTSDGTATGTTNFTWIMADPTATSAPVFTSIKLTGGNAGFIFKGVNVETNILDTTTTANVGLSMVSVTGSAAAPSRDIIFENVSLSSWLGHSSDPWNPSTYPMTDGHSDGTIQTASPYMGVNFPSQQIINVSAAANATRIFLNNSVPNGIAFGWPQMYVWSPGYFAQYQETGAVGITAPNNTGIPNGTIVQDVQGMAGVKGQGVVTTSASLPGTVTNNNAWLALDTKHMWVGVSGSWVDEGLGFITIGPCDPVADQATGCPSTNTPNGTPFVGCDPLVIGVSGGCVGGGVAGWAGAPTWNGTTRAFSSGSTDYIQFTPRMTTTPAGAWNHVDWDYTLGGFGFNGAPGTNNSDPTNPNDTEGAVCLSVKGSTLRYMADQVKNSITADVVEYNNRLKYRAGDAFDVYSSHRTIIANNFSSDTVFSILHQDIIQYAESFGTQLSKFYGNAAVNNEGYSTTDPTNQFVQSTRPISNTDSIFSGTYIADNIVFGSDNATNAGGQLNAVVHNDVFRDDGAGGQVQLLAGGKSTGNVATNGMMANNLTNAMLRNNLIPGITSNCTLDGNTVSGNISLATVNYGLNTVSVQNGNWCTGTGVNNSSSPGQYSDVLVWSKQDPRTGVSGIQSPFMAFHPLTPQSLPATGNGVMAPSPCTSNAVKMGTCSAGANGILDLRPNASFVGTTGAILGNKSNMTSIPVTGTIGEQYVLQGVATCFGAQGATCGPSGATWQPGLLVRIGNSATDATLNWQHTVDPLNSLNFLLPGYIPAFVGAGTNLGPQQPPADHDRKPWASSPSAGAYELH